MSDKQKHDWKSRLQRDAQLHLPTPPQPPSSYSYSSYGSYLPPDKRRPVAAWCVAGGVCLAALALLVAWGLLPMRNGLTMGTEGSGAVSLLGSAPDSSSPAVSYPDSSAGELETSDDESFIVSSAPDSAVSPDSSGKTSTPPTITSGTRSKTTKSNAPAQNSPAAKRFDEYFSHKNAGAYQADKLMILGDVSGGTLVFYDNIVRNCGGFYQLGDYVLRSDVMYLPGLFGLYLVWDTTVLPLEQAYEQGKADMDTVIALLPPDYFWYDDLRGFTSSDPGTTAAEDSLSAFILKIDGSDLLVKAASGRFVPWDMVRVHLPQGTEKLKAGQMINIQYDAVKEGDIPEITSRWIGTCTDGMGRTSRPPTTTSPY